MTRLLETARTILCVDDRDRWGFWCKACTPPDQTPEVIGSHREKAHAAKAAKRHEGKCGR